MCLRSRATLGSNCDARSVLRPETTRRRMPRWPVSPFLYVTSPADCAPRIFVIRSICSKTSIATLFAYRDAAHITGVTKQGGEASAEDVRAGATKETR